VVRISLLPEQATEIYEPWPMKDATVELVREATLQARALIKQAQQGKAVGDISRISLVQVRVGRREQVQQSFFKNM
jgi:hypothetical protein